LYKCYKKIYIYIYILGKILPLLAYQDPVEDSEEDSDSDTDDDPASGGGVRICAQPEPVPLNRGGASDDAQPTEDLELDATG